MRAEKAHAVSWNHTTRSTLSVFPRVTPVPPRAVFDRPDYKHGVLPAEVLIAVQPPLLCNFESSLIAVCVIISVIFNEVILEMRWLLPRCVRVMILSCL